VVADIDLVDETQFVDVSRNFRVINRLERGNDIVSELVELIRGHCRRADDGGIFRRLLGGRRGFGFGRVVGHAKNSCALTREAASVSTSSLVLYMPNDARQVAVRP